MTSTTHGNNVGKIVFSDKNESIAFKNEKPEEFKTNLNAKGEIYSRIYLEKSLGNIRIDGKEMMGGVYLAYDLYINGKKIDFKRSFGVKKTLIPENKLTYYTDFVKETKQIEKWTTWRLPVLPDLKDPELEYGNFNLGARAFALALLEQAAGTHEIKIELSAYSTYSEVFTDVIASGTFSLTLTDADKKRLASAYTTSLPKDEWRGSDKASILKEVKALFEQKIQIKPLMVGLLGNDWEEAVYTDTKGKYRLVRAWAIFPDTNGDGMSPLVSYTWKSDLSTSGWSKIYFSNFFMNGPSWDVEIETVKKAIAAKN